MSAFQLLQLISQGLFVFIAMIAAVNAWRRPHRASIDIALLFGAVALIVAVSWVEEGFGASAGRAVTALVSTLLMSLAYLLVRLVDDFMPLSRRFSRAAAAGLAAAVMLICVTAPPYSPLLVLYCVVYFVGLSIFVATAFVRAARRTSGVTHRRMQAVAAGSTCLGLIILIAGIASATPGLSVFWNVVSTVVGLICGIFFFLGCAPPAWLRRTWQEPEVRAFLGRAAALPRLADTVAIVSELERGAASALGALHATLGLWDAEAGILRYNLTGVPVEVPADKLIAGRAFVAQRPVFSANAERDDPEHAQRYRDAKARAVMAAPITAGDKRLGVLAVYAEHAPIFAEDDLQLVSLLANQAAVILESRALIDEASRVRAREEAARLKDDFLSAAAHDLKTPLTAMVAQAQLLERRARRNPSAPVDLDGIERLVTESNRLKRLVLELLDVARVEQGKLVTFRETVDLVDLARDACNRHTTTAYRCVLDATEPLVGDYDSTRVMQLLDNLLENAAKYSPEGGEICVRLWRDGDSARLTVTDPGIGIPAADLPHLFDRFHRGSNVNDRSFAGMGLGLFICRGIVEQHGGSMWARSPGPGNGSTFHVVLPVAPLEGAQGRSRQFERARAHDGWQTTTEQAS